MEETGTDDKFQLPAMPNPHGKPKQEHGQKGSQLFPSLFAEPFSQLFPKAAESFGTQQRI